MASIACSKPLELPPGPVTEYWLEPPMGIAITFPADAEVTDAAGATTLRLTGRRFGDATLKILGRPAKLDGAQKRKLGRGWALEFVKSRHDDERVATHDLRGVLTHENRRWGVECREHLEADGLPGTSEWCLPYLATVRTVEAKP